jgi:uncharacterized membrane protein YqgA involved in biofilm formation
MLVGRRIPSRIRESVVAAIGLATVVIGIGDVLGTRNMVFPLAATVLGVIVGESLRLHERLISLGDGVKRRIGRQSDDRFTEGFVTATLLFCIGPLTILGGIEDGTGQVPRLYFIKSALDGTMSLVFGSQYGPGAALSALSVLVVQGGIVAFGTLLDRVMSERQTVELFATGGLAVVGIGFNLLGVARIRVASFLPSLFIAPVLVAVFAR